MELPTLTKEQTERLNKLDEEILKKQQYEEKIVKESWHHLNGLVYHMI